MKLHFFDRQRGLGFRISVVDLCFIGIITGLTAVLYNQVDFREVAFIPAHLCVVFFLFCNVFRVRTRQELVWIASYLGAAGYAITEGESFWPIVLVVTTPVLMGVVAWAAFTGGYRGIFSGRLTNKS